MNESTPEVAFEATGEFEEMTAHGLLVAVVEQVKADGFFSALEQRVTLKMKKYDYWVWQKLATLWASIIVGCSHTVQINTRLGAHERAAAALFGLERFPDQSIVNDVLRACTTQTVEQLRTIHHRWMARYSRARSRRRWRALSSGRRVLLADIDQRAMTVSSKQYQLATRGWYGRKRGSYGYQLSLCYLGGEVGEVLDEFFDPGKTAASTRITDLLETLAWFCTQHKLARHEVVVRGDAAYGSVSIVALCQAYGFSYLFKGACSRRAKVLGEGVGPETLFELVQRNGEGETHWLADIGEHEHVGAPIDASKPRATTRTLVGVWVHWVSSRKRPGAKQRAKQATKPPARTRKVSWESYLTNLSATDLPLGEVIGFYHERATIERYFNDEQNALGARHVRTHHAEGAAAFQWLVAMANNQLRRVQHTTFKATPLEAFGLKRLIHTALQVPAFVRRRGARLIVSLPARHHVVRLLLGSWPRITAEPSGVPPPAVPPAPCF